MADCITIAPELSFQDEITELAAHLSRSIPNTTADIAREFVSNFESQVAQELDKDERKKVVKSIVNKIVELNGGLEATREAEVESSHFLLQHVLATTFDQASEEYAQAIMDINGAIKKGAQESSKQTRAEAASRVLINNYNSFPASSPLRPATLLTLLSLLSSTLDVSALPLTTFTLAAALSTWSISSSQKVDFLTSASNIYVATGNISNALDLITLALQESVDQSLVEKAVLLNLSVSESFSLDKILAVQGVKDNLGKAGPVVALFEGNPIEAIGKGKKWTTENAAWIDSAKIPHFTAESVLRKLRLIALVAICAKSETRQIGYEPIAKALEIQESEVETWVIDAVRSKLITARISQPSALITISSISSLSTPSSRFGPSEWQLLEKRLKEWKVQVDEARQVLDEAENVVQHGLAGRKGGKRKDEKKEKNDKEDEE
ncbi:uncharacterized protein L203_103752 [Cryptococcus depauperatus CBS 7841]|uniref:Uncharacterized protein n=1 Tax=Cryptococcus depauperatus CBS 7841 TaxID=1295531 RepID=A0A1E3IGC3_9TREE|nr:eukaryotic translation initiation factor 3 subunit M [Cryptococcus depauperatus CBS 7841]